MCEILKATRIMVKEIGTQVWIVGRADQGPVDLACQLRGMQQFMMDIAEGNLELVHRLLDFARQVTTRYAYALIQEGAHSTSIGEPLSGPQLIGPRNYRKLAQPYQRKMADELKSHGIILANHICGDTIPIIDDFISTGAQILEIDHKTDTLKAKEAARHKTCLLGNIDTGILARGTPQEVEDACRHTIEIMAPDSGFILGPGCAMGPETPPDNIHALVEAAKKYGVYR
jgi:MtaA/CmuA family methyltransferase